MNIEYIKGNNPIPFNIKPNAAEESYYAFCRTWNKIKWGIYYIFFPQHKNLRKVIPRSWRDLDGILEDFMDAVIIDFVENEKGLEQIELIEASERDSLEVIADKWGSVDIYNSYRNSHLQNFKNLAEIYTWVTSGRQAMRRYADSLEGSANWEAVEQAHKAVHDRDTKYFTMLIELRGYLWT